MYAVAKGCSQNLTPLCIFLLLSSPAPSPSAGASKGGDEPGRLPEHEEEEESPLWHGAGHCKWFNVRMGFGFISMSSREGSPLESPVDVFVHQVRSFSVFLPLFGCSGAVGSHLSLFISRCYNCGGLDHHAKECSLPPQPKKCHYCQSIMHMVANCPHKTVSQQPTSSQGRHEAEPQPSTSAFLREGGGTYGYSSPSYSQEGRSEISERSGRSPQEASSSKLSASPEEPSRKGPSVQKRKKT
uniref:Lin-28 homolog B n=1 Tax=Pavo cristatus TaxID=9049 RepID=A0A8C9L855_PAVCR